MHIYTCMRVTFELMPNDVKPCIVFILPPIKILGESRAWLFRCRTQTTIYIVSDPLHAVQAASRVSWNRQAGLYISAQSGQCLLHIQYISSSSQLIIHLYITVCIYTDGNV
jgi:hypothetical protein